MINFIWLASSNLRYVKIQITVQTTIKNNNPPMKACLWFPVFGHIRIGGKEMWTWKNLGPAYSLQAQNQPSHIEEKKKKRRKKQLKITKTALWKWIAFFSTLGIKILNKIYHPSLINILFILACILWFIPDLIHYPPFLLLIICTILIYTIVFHYVYPYKIL